MRRRFVLARLLLAVGAVGAVAAVTTSAHGASGGEAMTMVGRGAAASVNPKSLVLGKADVPSGFRLRKSQLSTKPDDPLTYQYGMTARYVVLFIRQQSAIFSGALTFRTPRDARGYLGGLVKQMREEKCSSAHYAGAGPAQEFSQLRALSVGAGGWSATLTACGDTAPDPTKSGPMVVWRHDRVVSFIEAVGVTIGQAVKHARVQQQRVAVAVRS